MYLWFVIGDHSFIAEACKALIADDAFTVPSPAAENAVLNAKALLKWLEHHKECAVFEKKLLTSLQECADKARTAGGKFHCDRIWTAYHFLRTSDVYMCDWECVLLKAEVGQISVICYQYIGDKIFKKLIKTMYPLAAEKAESSLANCELTYEETNAVRYAAGYVVKSLQKKMLKTTHAAQKDDFQLCLSQLVQADDEAQDESQDWIQLSTSPLINYRI